MSTSNMADMDANSRDTSSEILGPPATDYGHDSWAASVVNAVGALLFIVLLAPLLGLIAVAVWFDSGSPVLFGQTRIGSGLKPFCLLKFRTMYVASSDAPHREAIAKWFVDNGTSDPTQYKVTRDPRITRVGRLLRRTALDELPQLFNVLRREMNLVGPRPPLPYELPFYKTEYFVRFSVKPGITGPCQVRDHHMISASDMMALDLEYVQRRNLLWDVALLLRTVPAVLKHARREG